MKRFSLTIMITLFLLLYVTGLQAQLDNKAEELKKVLQIKDCTSAIKLVNSIQSADYMRVDGLSLLMSAVYSDCTEVVKILLDKGANTDVQHKEYALHLASMLGYTEIVKLLIEKGAKVDLQFYNGGPTALMLASHNGSPEIVKLLLDKGANVNIQRSDGGTALIIAAEEGHTEIVKLLLQNGANVDLKTTDSGQTALMLTSKQIRYENFKKLNTGMSPDEIVSLLSFETDINKSFFGGIFIGIGLLSKDSQKPSTYTGSLNLHEFIFVFDNGKLKEKSIDTSKIGTETINGQYIYEFIGKTKTTWSLINGKFNSNTVAIEYTEKENSIINEKSKQFIITKDKRLKDITDSLAIIGYKVIEDNGFDSFRIGKTRLQEIVSTLGPNFLREDYRKNGITRITYPELGISFYVQYDKKTGNGFLIEIRLRSPFKGYCFALYEEPNWWGVALSKTTLKEFKSYFNNCILTKWEGEDNCLFVKISRNHFDTKYVVVFESPIDMDYKLDHVINEFRIFKEYGIHIKGIK